MTGSWVSLPLSSAQTRTSAPPEAGVAAAGAGVAAPAATPGAPIAATGAEPAAGALAAKCSRPHFHAISCHEAMAEPSPARTAGRKRSFTTQLRAAVSRLSEPEDVLIEGCDGTPLGPTTRTMRAAEGSWTSVWIRPGHRSLV